MRRWQGRAPCMHAFILIVINSFSCLDSRARGNRGNCYFSSPLLLDLCDLVQSIRSNSCIPCFERWMLGFATRLCSRVYRRTNKRILQLRLGHFPGSMVLPPFNWHHHIFTAERHDRSCECLDVFFPNIFFVYPFIHTSLVCIYLLIVQAEGTVSFSVMWS